MQRGGASGKDAPSTPSHRYNRGEEKRPYLYYLDSETNQVEFNKLSAPSPVDLPPGETVSRTLCLTLGKVHSGSAQGAEPAREEAVMTADRAVFVAEIVGAFDKCEELSEPW